MIMYLTYFIGSHVFQSMNLHLSRLDLVQHLVGQLLLKLPERVLEGPELAVDRATESEEASGHDGPASMEDDLKKATNDPASILRERGEGGRGKEEGRPYE